MDSSDLGQFPAGERVTVGPRSVSVLRGQRPEALLSPSSPR